MGERKKRIFLYSAQSTDINLNITMILQFVKPMFLESQQYNEHFHQISPVRKL